MRTSCSTPATTTRTSIRGTSPTLLSRGWAAFQDHGCLGGSRSAGGRSERLQGVVGGHERWQSLAMSLLSKLFRRALSAVLLEAEGLSPIQNPSEEQVRDLILSLKVGRTSFASLTDGAGNYVQVAGNLPWCLIEHRRLSPLRHERAFQETPKPKYLDGAKLRTGAGDISLQHDEWFLLKDAAEICVAFLRKDPFPPHVNWRSMNETLGLS